MNMQTTAELANRGREPTCRLRHTTKPLNLTSEPLDLMLRSHKVSHCSMSFSNRTFYDFMICRNKIFLFTELFKSSTYESTYYIFPY